MNITVIGANGRVQSTALIPDHEVGKLSTRGNSYILGVLPSDLSDYWNGSSFEAIGDPPSVDHLFDYDLKQWVDPRTIEQVKEQKWSEIKSLRDQIEFGGFEFEGNIYDSDQVSQGRIMGAASAQVDQIWTLANNEMVELTAIQLSQLYQTLQAHIATIHERGRIARQLIYEAATIEQVEEITL